MMFEREQLPSDVQVFHQPGQDTTWVPHWN